MNEAYVVRKIITQIKRHVPQAVVLKMNDRSTSGIPDISVDYAGKHTWIEVKLLREHETAKSFRKHIDALQLATCRLLERPSRCLYFLAYSRRAILISPSQLTRFMRITTNYDMSNLHSFSGVRCSCSFNDTLDWLVSDIQGAL